MRGNALAWPLCALQPSGASLPWGWCPLCAKVLMGKARDAASSVLRARGSGEAGGIIPIVRTGCSLCWGVLEVLRWGSPSQAVSGDTRARLGRPHLSHGSNPLLSPARQVPAIRKTPKLKGVEPRLVLQVIKLLQPAPPNLPVGMGGTAPWRGRAGPRRAAPEPVAFSAGWQGWVTLSPPHWQLAGFPAVPLPTPAKRLVQPQAGRE